jgi:signal transduction histidine kinase
MFPQIELVSLGLATVIDTVLLLALAERCNRARVAVPIVALVCGAVLLHGGAFARTLLFDLTGAWARQVHWGSLVAVTLGLLIVPSAMTHACWRLLRTGMRPNSTPELRYLAAYLPVVAIVPLWLQIAGDPREAYLDLAAPYLLSYAVWLTAVNVGSALTLFRQFRVSSAEPERRFFASLAWIQTLTGVVHATILFFAVWRWPELRAPLQLIGVLAPVLPIALLGYFVMFYNFMQLMVERTLVYAAVLAAVMLLHHVMFGDAIDSLEERYRIDFGLLEALVAIGFVIAYQPLRQRVGEALRYLVGHRVGETRETTRRLSWELSSLAGREPAEIAAWFCDTVGKRLDVGFARLRLYDAQHRTTFQCGTPAATSPRAEAQPSADADPCGTLYRLLKQADEHLATPRSFPRAVAMKLLDAEASLAVRVDQPGTAGLMLFGRRSGNREFSQEEGVAVMMLVEQLGLMLHNSSLQAERIIAERRALQNDKLSTLGLLAGSIAHEIKNPLSSIKTLATVMAEDLGPASVHAEDLRLIIGEVDRLTQVTSQLLDFARPTQRRDARCSLRPLLESTLSVMRHRAQDLGVTLSVSFGDGPLTPAADEGALREVFFNLLQNGLEAAGRGGTLSVSCRHVDATEQPERIIVEIADDGPGMPAEVQDRLFEPFVSTKAGGTGLGLYHVGRQVRDVGGEITCRSSPTEGTLFTITLPTATIDEARETNNVRETDNRRETI